MRESGVDLVSGTWYGVLAPRAAPQAVIDLLNREIVAVLKTKELREQLETRGVVADIMTLREFSDFMRAEIAKWGGVMKTAGIRQED